MRKQIIVIWLCCAILLSSNIIISNFSDPVKATGIGNYPPPLYGDWLINTNTIIVNETITLNGNLSITSGGKLILRNCTLEMNCTNNGSYRIEVLSGGQLFIKDYDSNRDTSFDASVITSKIRDSCHRFLFWVENGAIFEMQNSELHECGYTGDYHSGYRNGGLHISSTESLIEGNLIENCFVGLYYNYSVTDGTHTITNNLISNCQTGIFFYYSHGENEVSNNRVENCTWGLYSSIPESHTDVINNTFSNNYCGACFSGAVTSGYPYIENNSFFINQIGLYLDTSYGVMSGNIYKFNTYGARIKDEYLNPSRRGLYPNITAHNNPFVNDTFSNNSNYDLWLENVNAYLLNTTCNKIDYSDAGNLRMLTVDWFLHIQVIDEMGAPILGATVNVYDNNTPSSYQSFNTTSDGFVRWIRCTNYTETSTGINIGFNPYSVIVEYKGLLQKIQVQMIKSEKIIITLNLSMIITNITISQLNQTSATIFWNTIIPSDSVIRYSSQSDLTNNITKSNSTLTINHNVTLSGLTPGTMYYFEIIATDGFVNVTIDNNGTVYYQFATAQISNNTNQTDDIPSSQFSINDYWEVILIIFVVIILVSIIFFHFRKRKSLSP